MYWKLEERTHDGEWRDVQGVRNPPKFTSKGEAFEYYFGKYADRRRSNINYRLAPVFSTQPVPIIYDRTDGVVKRIGSWVLADMARRCSECGGERDDRD